MTNEEALRQMTKQEIDNCNWEMRTIEQLLIILRTNNYGANETLSNIYGVLDALHNGITWKRSGLQANLK